MKYYLFLIASLLVSNNLFAADALTGTVEKQPLGLLFEVKLPVPCIPVVVASVTGKMVWPLPATLFLLLHFWV